jgi:hypothetical protein
MPQLALPVTFSTHEPNPLTSTTAVHPAVCCQQQGVKGFSSWRASGPDQFENVRQLMEGTKAQIGAISRLLGGVHISPRTTPKPNRVPVGALPAGLCLPLELADRDAQPVEEMPSRLKIGGDDPAGVRSGGISN